MAAQSEPIVVAQLVNPVSQQENIGQFDEKAPLLSASNSPSMSGFWETSPLKRPTLKENAQNGTWQCWDDRNTDPCHHDLLSMQMLSSTDGWAVGENGTILHWDGNAWSQVNSPTDSSLESVAMLNSTDGWAVGRDGTILHWDGNAWSQVYSPSYSLSSVAMLNSTDGWAVGYNTILHWDGSAWSEVNSPTSNSLSSVAMVNSTDGWVVGSDGTILHWDGNAWSQVNSPTTERLNSVAMASSTDGWAVGGSGTILHWDGNAWSQVNSPSSYSLSSVTMLNSTDGWAVGLGGTILHWNGSLWSELYSPTNNWLESVVMLNSTDGWAVGWDGTILHWDGKVWSKVASPTTERLNSVAMTSSTDGWAVGESGTILQWDGNVWSKVASPTDTSLESVAMLNSTDGWTVGRDGTILHWDGNAWSQVYSPSYSLSSVAMLNSTDGWAVGYNTILHWDGSAWSEVNSPTSNSLSSVAMVNSADGWAVGGEGLILRYTVEGQDTYSISGLVTDGSETGIEGVTVSDSEGRTATTDSNGNYTIASLALGNYTLTPSKESYTFDPISQTVSVQNADLVGMDFIGTFRIDISNFHPNANGYQFQNKQLERTWEMFEQFYGTDQVKKPNGSRCREAEVYFNQKYKNVANGWSCVGASMTSLLSYLNWPQPNAGPFAMGYFERLYDQPESAQLTNPIAYYSGSQLSKQWADEYYSWLTTCDQDPNQMVERIKQGIQSQEPVMISLNTNMGYHFLAPYRFIDVSATTTDIYVYDSEAPAKEGVIRFERDGKGWQWEYTFTGSLSGAGRGTGGCTDMFLIALGTSLEQGEPRVNFCQAPSDGLAPDAATGRMLVSLPAPMGDWVIQDSAERQLGWVNGQLVSEIPDAYFIPQALGASISDRTLYLPAAEYTVEVHNSPTQAIDYTLFGDGRMIEVAGQFFSSSVSSEIQVASGLEEVTLIHPQELSEFSLSFNSELPTLSRVATLNSIGKEGNAEIKASFDDEQLVLSREEGTLEYNLMLIQTGEDTSIFISEPLSLAANDTHTLKPTNWTSLTSESVILEIDQGSDGTVDQTVQLDNQVKRIYLPLLTR